MFKSIFLIKTIIKETYELHKNPESNLREREIVYDEVYDRVVLKDRHGKIHYFSSDEKIEHQLKNLNDRIDSLITNSNK